MPPESASPAVGVVRPEEQGLLFPLVGLERTSGMLVLADEKLKYPWSVRPSGEVGALILCLRVGVTAPGLPPGAGPAEAKFDRTSGEAPRLTSSDLRMLTSCVFCASCCFALRRSESSFSRMRFPSSMHARRCDSAPFAMRRASAWVEWLVTMARKRRFDKWMARNSCAEWERECVRYESVCWFLMTMK